MKIREFFTTCLTRSCWALSEILDGSTKVVQAGYSVVGTVGTVGAVGAVGARSAFPDLMWTTTDDVAFVDPTHWRR